MTHTPNKNPVDPENKRNQSQNKEQPPPPILRTELQIPHSIIDTYNTNQYKKNRLERWKFGIEVLTLVVITGYTCIAYHQWKEMHTSTVAVKEQFRIAKRAWINITECKFREPLSAKISNHIDLTVKNSGETPALQVIYKYRTWIEVAGKTIAEEKFTPSSKSVYGPGDVRFTVLAWTSPMSQEQVKLLESKKGTFFVDIDFTYHDIFDAMNLHHTRACFVYNPTVSINLAFAFQDNGCSYMD